MVNHQKNVDMTIHFKNTSFISVDLHVISMWSGSLNVFVKVGGYFY